MGLLGMARRGTARWGLARPGLAWLGKGNTFPPERARRILGSP